MKRRKLRRASGAREAHWGKSKEDISKSLIDDLALLDEVSAEDSFKQNKEENKTTPVSRAEKKKRIAKRRSSTQRQAQVAFPFEDQQEDKSQLQVNKKEGLQTTPASEGKKKRIAKRRNPSAQRPAAQVASPSLKDKDNKSKQEEEEEREEEKEKEVTEAAHETTTTTTTTNSDDEEPVTTRADDREESCDDLTLAATTNNQGSGLFSFCF